VLVREVLTSLTFRYIAKYLLVLSAAVFLLMVAIYSFFSYDYFRQLSRSIVEEDESLALVYNGQGLPGVRQYIDDQISGLSGDRFHYLVRDADGVKVAGDLPPDTRYREFEDGWLGFELAVLEWGESVDVEFLARAVELGDGYSAVVARGYDEAVRSGRLVFHTLSRATLATVLLGLVGGFFAAARTLQRVEWLNREISRIVQGDPAHRLDISEEKGYVRELARMMNQMLDQTESLMHGVRSVSDNIAHDLRTPLTRMRNELTQMRAKLPADSAGDVDEVIADCDALLASFNAVLRISKLEADSRLTGGSEVVMEQLIRDAVDLYEPLAQEKSVAITVRCAGKSTCRGEADLLFQMFANVLDNAIKYSPEGGTIEVSLGSDGDRGTRVVIADSGPGISQEHWDNVFRRFYRLDSSRSAQPGHGLGLSMAQAIAHYHGGTVDLSDNNPGLRVAVSLP
jgi:signal transduction histidine kinase